MVFGIVSSLAGLIKIRYLSDKAVIDNCIFRLHYKFTSSIFFLGCLLCTATAYIGNPIECMTDNDKMQNVINTYCWITSSYTLPGQHRNSIVGKHVVSPGVGPDYNASGEERRHNYYQWVPFMLFFQGLLFYAPHWFWKNWEDGKVGKISDGLRGTIAESPEERRKRQSTLVQYIVDSMSLHSWYATGYFLCEIINFINVISNIYLTDKFLGGKFLSFGLDVMGSRNSTISAFEEVFPRVTKCTFRTVGPSGTLQLHDHLCVLALNIINEKIYIFLWCWFIILSILSGLTVIYSIAIISSSKVRRLVLFRRFKFRLPERVRTIVHETKPGDFFLLHLLGQNINMVIFDELLEELSTKLQGYKPSAPSNASTLETYPIHRKKGGEYS